VARLLLRIAFLWAVYGFCKLLTWLGVPAYVIVCIVIGGFVALTVFANQIGAFLDKVLPR
jgi:hypothetical protein